MIVVRPRKSSDLRPTHAFWEPRHRDVIDIISICDPYPTLKSSFKNETKFLVKRYSSLIGSSDQQFDFTNPGLFLGPPEKVRYESLTDTAPLIPIMNYDGQNHDMASCLKTHRFKKCMADDLSLQLGHNISAALF